MGNNNKVNKYYVIKNEFKSSLIKMMVNVTAIIFSKSSIYIYIYMTHNCQRELFLKVFFKG